MAASSRYRQFELLSPTAASAALNGHRAQASPKKQCLVQRHPSQHAVFRRQCGVLPDLCGVACGMDARDRGHLGRVRPYHRARRALVEYASGMRGERAPGARSRGQVERIDRHPSAVLETHADQLWRRSNSGRAAGCRNSATGLMTWVGRTTIQQTRLAPDLIARSGGIHWATSTFFPIFSQNRMNPRQGGSLCAALALCSSFDAAR